MNSILNEQFTRLVATYHNATLTLARSGAAKVVIPKMRTQGNWSTPEVEVRFLVPCGFPFASPQHFWAYPELRLVEGHAAGSFGGIAKWLVPDERDTLFPDGKTGRSNLMPGFPGYHGTWFSMSPQSWNPNRDSLFTFAKMIETQRLAYDKAEAMGF